MTTFTLNNSLYLNVTPHGAYAAVKDTGSDISKQILFKLLQQDETPHLNAETISEICPLKGEDALDLLYKMQKLGLISGQKDIETIPDTNLEQMLPDTLGALADSKKVLLAENSGLYIGVSGFPHEAAEELAAIGANLSEVYQRHKGLLQGNLRFKQHAWGLIDAAGNNEVGFWPLYIGDNLLTLIIHGMPQFNKPEFKRLIWALVKRYGDQ